MSAQDYAPLLPSAGVRVFHPSTAAAVLMVEATSWILDNITIGSGASFVVVLIEHIEL